MGSGRWDSDTWSTYSSTHVAGKSTDRIYKSKAMVKDLDPLDITIRESRDSDLNPESNAIIVALDVTGSMSCVLDSMVRKGLPTLATEIYARKPVSDPHIMFMGVGDVVMGDRAPLQVTQFEADIKIAEQLSEIYIEKGGGGNNSESYQLPWYFAGMYTSIDCFEKRNKKGYLFTVGDEFPPGDLEGKHITSVFNGAPNEKVKLTTMLAMANRMYNVYHVIVEEGSCAASRKNEVYDAWTKVLGQNVIRLSDHTKLAEVIVSMIQANEGVTKDDIVKSWDGSTAVVINRALSDQDVVTTNSASGIVNFM